MATAHSTALRLALYTRVSSKDRQGDNFSLETQLEPMQAWAADNGHDVVAVFVEMEGASQFSEGLDRTELNKAMQLARSRQIDGLMYYKSDRFTRDIGDGILLRRELYKLGVQLWCYYSYPRQITNDTELLNVLEDHASAQFVANMREASMRGYRGKIEAGIFPSSNAPWGYIVTGKKRDMHVALDEDTSKLVELMHYWCLEEGLTTTQIAKKLTDMAVPTPGSNRKNSKRKRGLSEWTSPMVHRILTEEAYTGTWYANKYRSISKTKKVPRPREEWLPIKVPAIIDKDRWQATCASLHARDYERCPIRKRFTYLLARRIRCICGFSMTGQARKNPGGDYRLYYKCISGLSAGGSCEATHYRAEFVDRAVWDFVLELARDPEKLLKGYREAQLNDNERHRALQQQITLADREIADYQHKLDDILEMHRATRVQSLKERLLHDAEEYSRLLDELTAKRAKLAEQIQKETITDDHIANVVEFMHDISDELEDIDRSNDLEAKRTTIEVLKLRFTARIDNERQRSVDIHWLCGTYSKNVSTKDEPRRRARKLHSR